MLLGPTCSGERHFSSLEKIVPECVAVAMQQTNSIGNITCVSLYSPEQAKVVIASELFTVLQPTESSKCPGYVVLMDATTVARENLDIQLIQS